MARRKTPEARAAEAIGDKLDVLARVILAESEAQIADQFIQAGRAYEANPTALHLRAMNMLYEGLKERGALIVVPSTAVESMGLGTIAGLSALSGVGAPQAAQATGDARGQAG